MSFSRRLCQLGADDTTNHDDPAGPNCLYAPLVCAAGPAAPRFEFPSLLIFFKSLSNQARLTRKFMGTFGMIDCVVLTIR